MLSMLFKSAEVKSTTSEIDAFLNQHASLCRAIIRADATKLANIKEKTIQSIRNDGLKPDHLALILITNVLGRQLTSGQYHVRRGLLNAIGSDMLKLWSAAVSTMQQRGYYSSEEAQEDMRWIQSEVNNVG